MLAPAMAWCPALLTAAPRHRRGCLSAGAPGSLLAAAPPRPPFSQPLAQFLELRTRRLQFLFQPLLSLYRLAMHSAVIARLPALLYYLAPQLRQLSPARRRAATRIPPEPSHTSFLSTPIRLCPAVPHRFTEYLPLIFSMFSGGNKLQDVNRLGQDDALKRVLGSDRIPHATTIGKFLWRFGNDQQDKQRQGLAELRDTTAAIQQDAFAMLPRERRKVATLDWDSSIHEVYGQKKEGADFAYDNTWSYSALYGTLAETGDVLYLGLREGYRHTSYGTKEVLPGTIERVSKHFRQVRMRADSGYYSQALVKICEQREVEFFIVAKQHRNLMNAVREIQDSNWKSFAGSDLQAGDRGRRRRRRRANLKRKIAIRRKPNSRFKGAPEIAGMMFKPKSWNKARRYVIKRTPIVDKDDQQLYLDDGLRQYVYWIVVSNSKRSNEQVLRIAQGRGNQENLIKDLCVQQRLARSAGDRPAGVRARAL